MAKNPTTFGKENSIHQLDVVRGILRITRHPVLNAIALWAIVHILYNGDIASLIFFGTFLLTAIAGMPSIDAKLAQEYGDEWQRFAEQTSRLPLVAIISGRNRLSWREFGLLPLLVAIVIFLVLLTQHGRLFGVTVW